MLQYLSKYAIHFARYLAALLLVAGCASPRIENVTQLKAVYKVGTTDFAEFKRDARLVEIQHFPAADSMRAGPKFAALRTGPFQIVDQDTCDCTNSYRCFSIADRDGKQCGLCFDLSNGKLLRIEQ